MRYLYIFLILAIPAYGTLLEAVRNGNVTHVKKLIEEGANVNIYYQYGLTALHVAAAEHNNVVLEILIAEGADVNARTFIGITPIHIAIREECPADTISILIDSGADVTLSDSRGRTPLHTAVIHQCYDAVNILINTGADVTAKDEEWKTPSQYAMVSERIARLLLNEDKCPPITTQSCWEAFLEKINF